MNDNMDNDKNDNDRNDNSKNDNEYGRGANNIYKGDNGKGLSKSGSIIREIIRLNRITDNKFSRGYLVGGGLRDLLTDLTPLDIDLVFPAQILDDLVSQLDSMGKVVVLDELRSVYRFIPHLYEDETTNFYIDLSPIDGSDIETDLLNRDFTINAMALPLCRLINCLSSSHNRNTRDNDNYNNDSIDCHNSTIMTELFGSIIDPTGGMGDLKAASLRPVTSDIFFQDPLRLVRAARFYGLGYRSTDEIDELIREYLQSSDISNTNIFYISGDRLYQEINRIWEKVSLQANVSVLDFLKNYGIVEAIDRSSQLGQMDQLGAELQHVIGQYYMLWQQVFPNLSSREISAFIWFLYGFPVKQISLPKDLDQLLDTALRGFEVCLQGCAYISDIRSVNTFSIDQQVMTWDNKLGPNFKTRFCLYAKELVTNRSVYKLRYFMLGILCYKVLNLHSKNIGDLINYLEQEQQIVTELANKYSQVTNKYSGDRIASMVGKEPGPWLGEVLSQVHYLALMDRQDEISPLIWR